MSTIQQLRNVFLSFEYAAEKWSTAIQEKEVAYQKAIAAAADVINIELLCRVDGQYIPDDLTLSDDWRKLAAPLAAQRLLEKAKMRLTN